MSILFAATYPERTAALVLFGTFAKRVLEPRTIRGRRSRTTASERSRSSSDTGAGPCLDELAPSDADDAFKERAGDLPPARASPGAAVAL